MTKEETLSKLGLFLLAFEMMVGMLPQSMRSENREACAESIYEKIIIPNQSSMQKKPAKKTVKKPVAKKKK